MDKRKIHKIVYAFIIMTALTCLVGCRNSVMTDRDNLDTVLENTEEEIVDLDVMKVHFPEITDLEDVFSIILQGASKEYIAGYAVDENFLMWLAANKGKDVVHQLAWQILDDDMNVEDWYEITGESIHVLWTRYCEETGFQNYRTQNVFWMDCESNEETIIRLTGDFNFAEDWYTMEAFEQKENGLVDCIDANLMSVLQGADILFMNNEFVYSDAKVPLAGKAYTFRAEPDRITLLQELGADIVSLGNNHTYDFSEEGLLDTMEVLEEANIAYVGAGANIDDASKIVYMIANGRKIAFVAATEIERSTQYTKEATKTTAGVLKTRNPQRFVNVIKEAAGNSDYVIAVPHWGTEGVLYADASQKRQAKLYAEAGADVIIGGHPHRLQGVEYYEDTPVAYSLGNFWFSNGTLYTTVAQVVIHEDGELQLGFLPCEQKDLTTSLLTDKTEKDEFYHYLAKISSNIVIDEEGNVYNKKELSGEDDAVYPYDSDKSTTPVVGGVDNDGYAIDIVGNRKN